MAETNTENAGLNIPSQAVNEESKEESQFTQTAEQPKKKTGPDKGGFYWGLGRRKTSVARVRIKPGKGDLNINGKELHDYFSRKQDKDAVWAPLKAVNGEKNFEVHVNVKGGGTTGQAGATMLGIARALQNFDESYTDALRDGGYLTRDSRMVERKKPGQRGARRSFQFSKR